MLYHIIIIIMTIHYYTILLSLLHYGHLHVYALNIIYMSIMHFDVLNDYAQGAAQGAAGADAGEAVLIIQICVCIYIYIYVCVYIYIYTYIHIWSYVSHTCNYEHEYV